MPAKMRARPGTTTQQRQQGRGEDDPKLPGLAEALEVYRRIAELGSVQKRSGGVQAENAPGRNA
jgi:hypothetical protein